jgi:hypothetical protein
MRQQSLGRVHRVETLLAADLGAAGEAGDNDFAIGSGTLQRRFPT